jgi:hypothetical protein
MEPAGSTESSEARDHLVAFYETDGFLAEVVAGRLAPGILRGEHVLIIATGEHRAAFEVELTARGVDVARVRGSGQLELLDAGSTLPTLLSDGRVDVDRFRAVVADLVDRATASGHQLCVYGEMVALLWAAGDVTGALALEDLWNELLETRCFTLLCGYPLRGFDAEDSDLAFEGVCRRHTAIANECYAGIGAEGTEPAFLERDPSLGQLTGGLPARSG